MSALVAILILEMAPMVTLIRWRTEAKRGVPVDSRRASLYAKVSYVQAVLVLIMVGAATAMARGAGSPR